MLQCSLEQLEVTATNILDVIKTFRSAESAEKQEQEKKKYIATLDQRQRYDLTIFCQTYFDPDNSSATHTMLFHVDQLKKQLEEQVKNARTLVNGEKIKQQHLAMLERDCCGMPKEERDKLKKLIQDSFEVLGDTSYSFVGCTIKQKKDGNCEGQDHEVLVKFEAPEANVDHDETEINGTGKKESGRRRMRQEDGNQEFEKIIRFTSYKVAHAEWSNEATWNRDVLTKLQTRIKEKFETEISIKNLAMCIGMFFVDHYLFVESTEFYDEFSGGDEKFWNAKVF